MKMVLKMFWGEIRKIVEKNERLRVLYAEREEIVNGALYKLSPREYSDNSEVIGYVERLAEIDRKIKRNYFKRNY